MYFAAKSTKPLPFIDGTVAVEAECMVDKSSDVLFWYKGQFMPSRENETSYRVVAESEQDEASHSRDGVRRIFVHNPLNIVSKVFFKRRSRVFFCQKEKLTMLSGKTCWQVRPFLKSTNVHPLPFNPSPQSTKSTTSSCENSISSDAFRN